MPQAREGQRRDRGEAASLLARSARSCRWCPTSDARARRTFECAGSGSCAACTAQIVRSFHQGVSRMWQLRAGVIAISLIVSSAAPSEEFKITVLYSQPKSAEEFDKYYFGKHMPMVYALNQLKRVEVARAQPAPDGSPSPYYIVTELWFRLLNRRDEEIKSRPAAAGSQKQRRSRGRSPRSVLRSARRSRDGQHSSGTFYGRPWPCATCASRP